MFSIKEIRRDLGLSFSQILSPEIILVSFVEGAYEERGRPLSFSEIQQLLVGKMDKDVVYRSLDRTLDAGLLTSEDGFDRLDLEHANAGKYHYRGYKPAPGEFETAHDFLMKIASLIENDTYPEIGNGDHQSYEFSFASIHDAKNFIDTIGIIDHIQDIASRHFKQAGLPHTFVYKLLGCIWINSELWQETETIRITTAQYGRIPALSSSIGQLKSKYVGYVMRSLKEWEDTGSKYRFLGSEDKLKESIGRIGPALVQEVESLVNVFLMLTDAYLVDLGSDFVEKGIPSRHLNILLTCPDRRAASESCRFECDVMFRWLALLLKTDLLWSLAKNARDQDKMFLTLKRSLDEALGIPKYCPPKSNGFMDDEDPTALDSKNALLETEEKLGRAYINPERLESILIGMQKAILSQACRARKQISVKLSSYYVELGEVLGRLHSLAEDPYNAVHRRTIEAVIERTKPPKKEPDWVSDLDSMSKGMIALVCGYFPEYIPDEITTPWIEDREQRASAKKVEGLLKGKGDIDRFSKVSKIMKVTKEYFLRKLDSLLPS